jgi:tripartite-type tricarboxylate transporter receptor subunit TctC
MVVKSLLKSLTLLALVGHQAWAQAPYPNKPIRMVVPYPPGAITDVAARLLAEHMGPALGQQIIIENKGGAGTRIGMQAVASASPDGYTLLFANSVTHGTMPAMSRTLPFDPIKDFTPISPAFSYTSLLTCHPSVPANNLAELIDHAKKNPGKLTNATAGPGTGHHLMGGLFMSISGIDLLQVHYKGGGPALQDVLGGTANCFFGGGDVKSHVQAGRLRAYATTGLQPDPTFPGVPTMDSAGAKGFHVVWWQGVAGPANLPEPIVRRLNQAVNDALKSPALQSKAQNLGLLLAGGSPDELRQFMRDDIAKYTRVVKEAKIPLED